MIRRVRTDETVLRRLDFPAILFSLSMKISFVRSYHLVNQKNKTYTPIGRIYLGSNDVQSAENRHVRIRRRAVLARCRPTDLPTSARRRQASAACARLSTLSAPPRARARASPPRSPSALASPPAPAGARRPLTAAHTAPRPAPPAASPILGTRRSSCLSAPPRARAPLPAISSALASTPPAARASPRCCAPRPWALTCTCTRAACTPAANHPFPTPRLAGLRCRHVRPTPTLPKIRQNCGRRSKLSKLKTRS